MSAGTTWGSLGSRRELLLYLMAHYFCLLQTQREDKKEGSEKESVSKRVIESATCVDGRET